MDSFYLAQDDSPPHRLPPPVARWLWLALFLLFLAGLGALAGWTIRDWQGVVSESTAAIECPVCQARTSNALLDATLTPTPEPISPPLLRIRPLNPKLYLHQRLSQSRV